MFISNPKFLLPFFIVLNTWNSILQVYADSCTSSEWPDPCPTDEDPVCAQTPQTCFLNPCPQTTEFSNSCNACKSTGIESYTVGKCFFSCDPINLPAFAFLDIDRPPVCGYYQSDCNDASCRKTFSKATEACDDGNIVSFTNGACPDVVTEPLEEEAEEQEEQEEGGTALKEQNEEVSVYPAVQEAEEATEDNQAPAGSSYVSGQTTELPYQDLESQAENIIEGSSYVPVQPAVEEQPTVYVEVTVATESYVPVEIPSQDETTYVEVTEGSSYPAVQTQEQPQEEIAVGTYVPTPTTSYQDQENQDIEVNTSEASNYPTDEPQQQNDQSGGTYSAAPPTSTYPDQGGEAENTVDEGSSYVPVEVLEEQAIVPQESGSYVPLTTLSYQEMETVVEGSYSPVELPYSEQNNVEGSYVPVQVVEDAQVILPPEAGTPAPYVPAPTPVPIPIPIPYQDQTNQVESAVEGSIYPSDQPEEVDESVNQGY